MTIRQALNEAWIGGYVAPNLTARQATILEILQKLQKKPEISNDEKGVKK